MSEINWVRLILSLTFLLFLAVINLPAQDTQTTAQPVVAVPALDELETTLLRFVRDAQTKASSACQALDAVKDYDKMRTTTQGQIEKRHPGFTVNWQTFLLTAKGGK